MTYEPYKQPRRWSLPPLSFTEEQATAIADPETTITQYVNQMFTAFVRGDTDLDAGWDAVPRHPGADGPGPLPPGLPGRLRRQVR